MNKKILTNHKKNMQDFFSKFQLIKKNNLNYQIKIKKLHLVKTPGVRLTVRIRFGISRRFRYSIYLPIAASV